MRLTAEIVSKCLFLDVLEPLKIRAHLYNFYFHNFKRGPFENLPKKQYIELAGFLDFFFNWNNE